MNSEAATLYKLMILYMLSKVNFPLSNVQLQTFMLDKQYTNYFTFQETINRMVEDGFIQELNYRNSTQYKLTQDGEDTIAFFYTKISPAIRADIDNYLTENKYELKCEVGTTSNYYRTTNGTYVAELKVKEGENNLIELNLNVPLEDQAKAICDNWKESSQDIYEHIMHKLM
ncbi:MAG: DUF4364 family protein [Lachnospira sp.]